LAALGICVSCWPFQDQSQRGQRLVDTPVESSEKQCTAGFPNSKNAILARQWGLLGSLCRPGIILVCLISGTLGERFSTFRPSLAHIPRTMEEKHCVRVSEEQLPNTLYQPFSYCCCEHLTFLTHFSQLGKQATGP
jgi:hypothetical protein